MSDEEMNAAVADIAARFTLDPATGKWTREHKREKLTTDLVATTIERDNWEQTAAHYLDGMHYYRGLVQSIGETIGEAAYLQDDGGKVDSVLCAKVPELVVELKRERDEAREDLKITQEAWVKAKAERVEALRERDEAREALREIAAADWRASGELRGMAKQVLEVAK